MRSADPDRVVSGNTFEATLCPMSVAELLASHWELRPAFVPGTRARFDPLGFNLHTFACALENATPGLVKAADVSSAGIAAYRIIETGQARECFDSGMTVCITGLDRYVPPLEALSNAAKLSLALGGDVHCNGYLSPSGGGFGVHFDTQSIFLLQISGSKSWEYGTTAALEFPRESLDGYPPDELDNYRKRHPWASIRTVSECDFARCELYPGDLLYLPPGTWHRGRAGAFSLAVTLTCPTLDFAAALSAFLEQRINNKLAWRRSMPAAKGGRPNELSLTHQFIEDRLTELRALVASLGPADFIGSLGDHAPAPPDRMDAPHSQVQSASLSVTLAEGEGAHRAQG